MANRIRRENSIQTEWLWRLFAVCIVLTMIGALFMFQQVRIHKLADDISKLEKNCAKLEKRNAGLQLQVNHLKSPRELQKKMQEMRLGLIHVTEPSAGIKVFDASFPRQRSESLVAGGNR